MAKISVEFDTKTKSLSLSMDGKEIPNVIGVNLYKYSYSEKEEATFDCSITAMDDYKNDGYKSYTQIIAKESKLGLGVDKQGRGGASEYPENKDFIVEQKECLSVAQQCLQKLLTGK